MKKLIKRVYVAGPYSADNVITILDNMRRGMRAGYELLQLGFAPFCCWFDYHFSLQGECFLEQYYEYSMVWLEVADAVLVLPDSENSIGTQNEIKRAKELGIPIFYSIKTLVHFNEEIKKCNQ